MHGERASLQLVARQQPNATIMASGPPHCMIRCSQPRAGKMQLPQQVQLEHFLDHRCW